MIAKRPRHHGLGRGSLFWLQLVRRSIALHWHSAGLVSHTACVHVDALDPLGTPGVLMLMFQTNRRAYRVLFVQIALPQVLWARAPGPHSPTFDGLIAHFCISWVWRT